MKTYGWLVGIPLALALAALAVRIILPLPPLLDDAEPVIGDKTAPVTLPPMPPRPVLSASVSAGRVGGGQDSLDDSPPLMPGMESRRRRGGDDGQPRFRPWSEGHGGDLPEGEGRRGGGGMRGMDRGFVDIDPAVREELQELRRNNPDAFRERIQGMMEERRDRRTQAEEVLLDLAETLRATGRHEIREELRARLSEQYDQRLERDRRRLEQLQNEQERLRDEIGQRSRDKDAVIEQYLGSLSPN